MWKWLQNWKMDRGWKNFEALLGKSLDCLEEMISRNMYVKGNSDEDSDGSQEHDGEKNLSKCTYHYEQNLGRNMNEESEKTDLKLNIQKTKILVPSLHGKQMGKSGNSDRFYFLGLQNPCGQ